MGSGLTGLIRFSMGWVEMVPPGHDSEILAACCPPAPGCAHHPSQGLSHGTHRPLGDFPLSPTPGTTSALPGGEFLEDLIYPSPGSSPERKQSRRGWNKAGISPGSAGNTRAGIPQGSIPGDDSLLHPPALLRGGSRGVPRDPICGKSWDLRGFNSWPQVWGRFPAHPSWLWANPGM